MIKKEHFNIEFSKIRSSIRFFRISIGILALVDFLSLFLDKELFFSGNSNSFPISLGYIYSEYFVYFNKLYPALYQWIDPQLLPILLAITYSTSLIALILGKFPRVAAISALLHQLFIYKTFACFNYGYDQFMTTSLFYLVLFPLYRLNDKNDSVETNKEDITFNFLLYLKANLFILYFIAGLAKIFDGDWWTGNALWRSLASINNSLHEMPMSIYVIMGISTFSLELFYPVLIQNRYTKKITFISIMLMHLSIAYLLELYSFACVMIIWNITAWYKWEK